jgi:hypothetical protein
MFHEMIFKASIFGDFDNIKPTPQAIMDLVKEFAEFEIIPSTFTETNSGLPAAISVTNILPLVTKNRLRLTSENEGMDIFIFSYRIDINFKPKDFPGFSGEQIPNMIKKTKTIFEQLLNKYTKSASRLALNTTTLLIDLPEEQKRIFLGKFVPDGSFSNPLEWSTHLMKRESIELNENQDTLNIIANIATAIGQEGQENKSRDFNGFSIDFDINTIAENTAPRFTLPEIGDFLIYAVNLKESLITDLTSGIERGY